MLKLQITRWFLAGLTVALAWSPLGAAAAPVDDAKAAAQRFADGMNAGDPRVLSLCAPSTTIIDDMPPYVWSGPGACTKWVQDLLANMKDTGTTTMHAAFDPAAVADVHDKTAYVVYPVRFTMTVKGAQVAKSGVLTFIMDQSADGWKFTHITWSRTTPSP